MNWTRNALCITLFTLGVGAYAQVLDPSSYSYQQHSSSNQNNSNSGSNSTQKNSNSTNTNATKGKATPTPHPSGTPMKTVTGSKPTTGTRAAASGAAPKAASGKGASAPGSTRTGQIKEVTHGMVEAIKTRKVEYDPAEAADDPSLIVLNAPKYKGEDNSITINAGKSHENDGDSIVHPL